MLSRLPAAGMVPVYLKYKYRPHNVFRSASTVFAIHNLAYQGTDSASLFPMFRLPDKAYSTLEWIFQETDGRRTPVRTYEASGCYYLLLATLLEALIATCHSEVGPAPQAQTACDVSQCACRRHVRMRRPPGHLLSLAQ